MNNPSIFTKPFFVAFSVISIMVPSIAHADSEYMAQHAHKICLEYGAKPGTRLFYRCMKSQMRKEQYNNIMCGPTGRGKSFRIVQEGYNPETAEVLEWRTIHN